MRARHLGLAFRRVALILGVLACLAGGALAVRAASVWTASTIRFPETPPSIATLTQRLADEQARADALQAELDQIVGGSTELASALDEAGSRLGTYATAAESARAGLAAAQARLLVLRQALAAAGVPAATRAPAPAPAALPAGCVQPQLELNGVWNCQH